MSEVELQLVDHFGLKSESWLWGLDRWIEGIHKVILPAAPSAQEYIFVIKCFCGVHLHAVIGCARMCVLRLLQSTSLAAPSRVCHLESDTLTLELWACPVTVSQPSSQCCHLSADVCGYEMCVYMCDVYTYAYDISTYVCIWCLCVQHMYTNDIWYDVCEYDVYGAREYVRYTYTCIWYINACIQCLCVWCTCTYMMYKYMVWCMRTWCACVWCLCV